MMNKTDRIVVSGLMLCIVFIFMSIWNIKDYIDQDKKQGEVVLKTLITMTEAHDSTSEAIETLAGGLIELRKEVWDGKVVYDAYGSLVDSGM